MQYFRQFPKVRGGSALWAGYPQATTLLLNETFESPSVVSVALDASEDPDVASFSVDAVGVNPTVSLSAVEGADTASFSVGAVSTSPTVSMTASEGADTASFAVANTSAPVGNTIYTGAIVGATSEPRIVYHGPAYVPIRGDTNKANEIIEALARKSKAAAVPPSAAPPSAVPLTDEQREEEEMIVAMMFELLR